MMPLCLWSLFCFICKNLFCSEKVENFLVILKSNLAFIVNVWKVIQFLKGEHDYVIAAVGKRGQEGEKTKLEQTHTNWFMHYFALSEYTAPTHAPKDSKSDTPLRVERRRGEWSVLACSSALGSPEEVNERALGHSSPLPLLACSQGGRESGRSIIKINRPCSEPWVCVSMCVRLDVCLKE